MKNLLKKYLLATASDPFMNGFSIVLWSFGLITILLVAIGVKNITLTLVLLGIGFVLGITAGIVQKYVSNKYLTHISQIPYDVKKVVLKTEDGNVVGFGKGFWGKEGNITIAILSNRPEHYIAEFSRKIHGVNVTIKVNLNMQWEINQDIKQCYGFNPQELFNLYVHYGSTIVEGGVTAAFGQALSESPEIQDAMWKYYNEPFALIQAVQNALPKIDFQYPLRNIVSIQATLDTNSILEPVMFMRAGNPG